MQSISLLLDTVDSFTSCSGLRLNKRKSQAFFCNVGEAVVASITQKYGFSVGELPISYLGLPLITGQVTQQVCAPLIQRLCQRVETWSVRVLRYSGRLQLITSVLQGIQGYWATYLFLPKGVLKKIQSIFARFLWSGNLQTACHYKVAWEDCCAKKDEGGLGIRNLFEWNRAAVLFQIWRLSSPNPASLWLLWVHSCLLKNKAFWMVTVPYKCPWNIRKILNHKREAIHFLSYTVATDSQFKLWKDPWLSERPLLETYGTSIISAMDSSENALIQSWIINGVWAVSSSNDYRAVEIRSKVCSHIIGTSGMVRWDGESNVRMHTVWETIRRRHAPKPWLCLVWNSFYIPSCTFITWMALRGRLSTKDRQVFLSNTIDRRCVLCRCYDESIEHIFTICPYSYVLFRECPYAINLDWNGWQGGDFFQDRLTALQKNIGYLYITISIYLIWRERNDRVHSNGIKRVEQVNQHIKRMFREKLFTSLKFRSEVIRDPSLSNILY